MSDEYLNSGTVRRRPRADHQRTESEFDPIGAAQGDKIGAEERNGAKGSYKRNGRNGHAAFDEESATGNRSEPRSKARERRREYRDKRTRQSRSNDREEKRERPLPWREIAAEAPLFRCPFDPWRLFGAVKRRTGSILMVAAVLTVIGFFVGMALIPYTMTLGLIRKTSNAVVSRTDSALPNQFLPYELSDGTLYAFMKSPTVIHNVLEKANEEPRLAALHITPDQLSKAVSIVPIPNPDWVLLKLKTFGDLRSMADLINLYGKEAVDHLVDVQRGDAVKIYTFLTNRLELARDNVKRLTVEKQQLSGSGLVAFDKETENEIADVGRMQDRLRQAELQRDTVQEQLKSFQTVMPNSRLMKAKQELAELLITRNENNRDVIDKRAEIARLEKLEAQQGNSFFAAAPAGGGSEALAVKRMDLMTEGPKLEREIKDLTQRIAAATNSLYQRKGKDLVFAVKQTEFESAKKAEDEIQRAAREAQLYAQASLGYLDIHDLATDKNIDKSHRWMKVALVALLFGLLGFVGTAGIALVGEALDTTLKTPEDVMRICKLPVLATLGDLRKMSAKQQVDWAFRTLTLLKGKLNRDPDEALVCGIISANHGEGRSTWVNLLVNAASQRGLRVLTVDTRPSAAGNNSAPAPAPTPETVTAEKAKTAAADKNGHSINLPDEPSTSDLPVAKDPLSTPEKVAEQFDGPSPQALVHIPLPGWVWSIERRKQWYNAVDHWKQIDNLVIFVELPPACESESVLLAENLPQVIWLVGSGMADSAETAAHLETLRHAHCNLVGAVLNHAPPPFLNMKIGRWLNPVAAIAILASLLCFNTVGATADSAGARGETQPATLTSTNRAVPTALSGTARRQRANWQQHLTFGAGDVIDIHYANDPSRSRTNVIIGPDGRIDYMEAIGVKAAGLTVDELQKALDDELKKTIEVGVRTIVIPVSFSSKKYFMLGKVNTKGVFTLDRPLTLIEAVARARGLETGLYQRTTVELADLGHSFIVRNGEKLPVNFERLFLEGDLSQNVPIEPNDYVYFASTGAQDIYVLGEVMSPGPLGFVSSATVISAITDRGGFTDRAFKRRVLVVRGSLNEPETFVINTDSALDGHSRDFRLQPRDIVYVSRRPWNRAEELLDEAAQSFIQGAVTTWSGINIGPIIKTRLLPDTRGKGSGGAF